MQVKSFAVYQNPDGALCVLSNIEATGPRLKKVSRDFRSLGRALIARMRLERPQSNGGDNVA